MHDRNFALVLIRYCRRRPEGAHYLHGMPAPNLQNATAKLCAVPLQPTSSTVTCMHAELPVKTLGKALLNERALCADLNATRGVVE
jgi:hypothetical protein